MRSTEGKPLTISLRRADVKAFWILVTALLGATIWIAAAAAGARYPLLWAIAALIAPLPGVFSPVWLELGVRAWNKGVRLLSGVMRRYVLKVYYFVLFAALARTTAGLALDRRAEERTRWVPRTPSVPRGAWVVFLRPLTMLLALLADPRQESAPPPATYTLY